MRRGARLREAAAVQQRKLHLDKVFNKDLRKVNNLHKHTAGGGRHWCVCVCACVCVCVHDGP